MFVWTVQDIADAHAISCESSNATDSTGMDEERIDGRGRSEQETDTKEGSSCIYIGSGLRLPHSSSPWSGGKLAWSSPLNNSRKYVVFV